MPKNLWSPLGRGNAVRARHLVVVVVAVDVAVAVAVVRDMSVFPPPLSSPLPLPLPPSCFYVVLTTQDGPQSEERPLRHEAPTEFHLTTNGPVTSCTGGDDELARRRHMARLQLVVFCFYGTTLFLPRCGSAQDYLFCFGICLP